MPTSDERLASLEARVDRIDDLFALVTELRADMRELRADMHRQTDGLRTDMTRQFDGVNRQMIDLRADAHRDFKWIVGIQLTTMAGVIAALVGALYR
jgi:hypothetical protein